MKRFKFFTGLFLCLVIQTNSYSQTVAIYDYLDSDPEPEDLSGTIVDAPFGSAIRRFYIDNTAGGSFNFRITRVKIEEALGAQDYMAFGQNEGVADVFLPDVMSPLDTFTTPFSHMLIYGVNGFLASYYIYNGSNGCSQYRYYILNDFDDKLDSVDVRFCTNVGIEDNEEIAVSIYPNPAQDELTVTFENQGILQYEIVVYDIAGSEIMRASNFNAPIDVSMLKPGSYIVKLIDPKSNQDLFSKSVVIE